MVKPLPDIERSVETEGAGEAGVCSVWCSSIPVEACVLLKKYFQLQATLGATRLHEVFSVQTYKNLDYIFTHKIYGSR